MTNLEKLYRELATEFQLPVNVVEQICRSQFRFIRETMEGDTFPTIRLAFLGRFQPMPQKLERYKNSKYWDSETGKTIKNT